MHPLIQDLQFSLRLMRKRPGMTSLILAALVLGIGINTAIFSVVNAVLLRPLPIRDPDRLVWLRGKNLQSGSPVATSYPDFLDWRAQSRSFEALAASYYLSFTLTEQGPPHVVKAIGISASGFRVFGVSTILGRDFTETDDQSGANRVVVLTHAFWQHQFGGDVTILGKTLVFDGRSYIVIGVLQPTHLKLLDYPDVYVANGPLINSHLMERDTWWFFPYGRLKPNVTMSQAQAEMNTIASRLAAQYADTNKNMGVTLESVAENLGSDRRKPLLLLMLASSLIFVLATINVLTLFLAGTVERARELSVRLALGAARSALLRQLFVQALIFAFIGGALGLFLAETGLALFLQRFPDVLLRIQETSFDFRVFGATVGMAFTTTLLATLLPAFYAFRLKINSELNGEWSSYAPKYWVLARSALILTEVALASGLALVSGLLIKSLYEVEQIDLGFNPHYVFTFQITPPPTRYNEPENQAALYKAAIEKLATLPGMEMASATSGLPLTPQGWTNTLETDSQSPIFGQQLTVEDEAVLPHYFEAMRIPLLQGRDFTDADHEKTQPVAIVDDALAAKLWPGQNPMGKRIRMALIRGAPYRWLEVVGVVREVKHFAGPEGKVQWMQAYVPQYQDTSASISFVVNTTIPEGAAKTAAENAFHALDKDLPVEKFQTVDAYFDAFLTRRKVGLLLLSAFAGVGIVLGMIGIYGVVANATIQRRREIAIRMALGATRSRTMALITGPGLLATAGGIAIGFGVVMSLTRILASMLYGVSALDPTIYALSALILIVFAAIASIIPALHLFRFNIQEILRQ